MSNFTFSRKELSNVLEEAKPLRPAGTQGDAIQYVPPLQLAKADQYDVGGCPVMCRSSIVRLAFMKLLAVTILSAIAAGWTGTYSYSCTLSAAVCGIASVHYFIIWLVRAQVVPKAYDAFVSKIGINGGDGRDGTRLVMQEMVVDSLRHSDWSVTLWILELELFELAKHANPDGKPWISAWWCAFMQPLIIFCGTIPRFYVGEFRGAGKRVAAWAWVAGALGYAGGITLFALSAYSLLDFVWQNGTPPNEDLKRTDAYIVTATMAAQLAYPLISLFSIFYLHCLRAKDNWAIRGDDYPALLSFYKDVGYGGADIFCKAGLGLWCVIRATL